MLKWLRKDYEIKICLFTDYVMLIEECWMHTEEYMSSEFLNKVKALENFIQCEYNQYEMYQYSEQIVRKETDNYTKLIIIDEELIWFKELWRKFTESQHKLWSIDRAQETLIEVKSLKKSKNLKLSQ